MNVPSGIFKAWKFGSWLETARGLVIYGAYDDGGRGEKKLPGEVSGTTVEV
jgi:hypothetical protein